MSRSSAIRLIKKQISKGDYHFLRIFALWFVFFFGGLSVLTFITTPPSADSYAFTGFISFFSLVFYFLVLNKSKKISKNLYEEIKENCHISIFLGIITGIASTITTYALYSEEKYMNIRPIAIFFDALAVLSLFLGIIILIIIKNKEKSRRR